MIAHGLVYHWPLVARIALAIVYLSVVVPVLIYILNWVFLDYRRMIVATVPWMGLFLWAAIFDGKWWFLTYVFGGVAVMINWSRSRRSDGPKPKEPFGIHPWRWVKKVRRGRRNAQ